MAVAPVYVVTEWNLKPGDRILRTALHATYGGRPQGGIGPSRVSPNVLIFTDPAAGEPHGYFDGWQADGRFHYTGEGQRGDQRMVSGNATILRHAEEGRALRLFQGARDEVEYVGEFEVEPEHAWYETDAPETDGGPIRKVIVFPLRPVDTEPQPPESPLAEVQQGPTVEAVPVEEQYTERSFVDPGRVPYEAERREAKLVRALRDHLRSIGHKVVRYRILPNGELKPLYADLYDEPAKVLVEAKGSVTREAFRMAIGQLADYSRFLPDTGRAILVPEQPRTDLLALAESVGVSVVWPADGTYAGSPKVPWLDSHETNSGGPLRALEAGRHADA
jgi:hypothetical protein